MEFLFLTPASLSYLTQFILSGAITVYLTWRLRLRTNRNAQSILLAGTMGLITIFIGLLFLDISLMPTPRLFAVYLENTALGVLLTLLLQFAYHFPVLYTSRKREAAIVLAASMGYTLWEAGYAVYRYWLLLGAGDVVYRPNWADLALAVVMVWVPLAFMRQAVSADGRAVHWLRKLVHPQGTGARAGRDFALIYLILPVLAQVNILRGLSLISTTLYNIILSAGILAGLLFFIISYINYLPESTSFMIKLSGITLTLLLVMLGIVSWVVTPAQIAAYQPAFVDHQTLHFSPNAQGGYDVKVVPFHFETKLGEKLVVSFDDIHRSQAVAFPFPFHGRTYAEVYVTSSGLLSLGEPLYHPNLQNSYGHFPGIFPLLIDLDSAAKGGVHARADSERLVVTWDHIPAINQPEAVFTFQAVLYRDGGFDFTYNGLPDPLVFSPEASPSANPWLRGMTPGLTEPVTQTTDLSQAGQSGRNGLVQDFNMDFRSKVHHFLAPLAWLVLGGSLVILVGLPLLFDSALVQPLELLLAGVRKMDGGKLDVQLPVRYNDEIGVLTAAFNNMVAQLHSLVGDLDGRVRTRTEELTTVNEELRLKLEEIERLQEQLREQAIHDPLTGLFNRRYLHEMLVREISAAERSQQNIGFIMMDIDHFKSVNDLFGHDIGDRVLQEFGRTLLGRSRKGDIACRLGGEEFILIMPGATLEITLQRADEIRRAFEALSAVIIQDPKINITLSAGGVTYPTHGTNFETLFKNADAALYQAKHSGRNRVEAFHS
jgi:diguanylate cyclase (GGDEF)-like protein